MFKAYSLRKLSFFSIQETSSQLFIEVLYASVVCVREPQAVISAAQECAELAQLKAHS